jgi:hypothetical protein
MPKRRRIKMGYGAFTLRSRISELIEEALEMGQDGRMKESTALEVAGLLAKARERVRPKYEQT